VPIIDGLVTVTVTPGSTALLLSNTLPLIDPVVLAPPPCANAVVAIRHAARTAITKVNPRRLMNVLLLKANEKRNATNSYTHRGQTMRVIG